MCLIIKAIRRIKTILNACRCKASLGSIASSGITRDITWSIHVTHSSCTQATLHTNSDHSTSINLYVIHFNVGICDI